MKDVNNYIAMLKQDYKDGTNNHLEHNANPLYWSVLLRDISVDPTRWEGKTALDFGCGQGRNVTNLLTLAKFARVDGVDISETNIKYCTRTYKNQPSHFHLNDGNSLVALTDNTYDFIMSTIVFQHICVHTIRFNLKKEIYRILKPNGIFSFQMGYGAMQFKGHGFPTEYHANMYDVQGSNGSHDVRVTDPTQLVDDLHSIGFTNITYRIEQPFLDGGHPNWIYVRCEK